MLEFSMHCSRQCHFASRDIRTVRDPSLGSYEHKRKTAPLGGRHSCSWWRWRESNSRPEALDSQDYMLSRVIVLSP